MKTKLQHFQCVCVCVCCLFIVLFSVSKYRFQNSSFPSSGDINPHHKHRKRERPRDHHSHFLFFTSEVSSLSLSRILISFTPPSLHNQLHIFFLLVQVFFYGQFRSIHFQSKKQNFFTLSPHAIWFSFSSSLLYVCLCRYHFNSIRFILIAK